jgi:hypothetical protein
VVLPADDPAAEVERDQAGLVEESIRPPADGLVVRRLGIRPDRDARQPQLGLAQGHGSRLADHQLVVLGATVREQRRGAEDPEWGVEVSARRREILEARPRRQDHELDAGRGFANGRLQREQTRNLQGTSDGLVADELRELPLLARDHACTKHPKDHPVLALVSLESLPGSPTLQHDLRASALQIMRRPPASVRGWSHPSPKAKMGDVPGSSTVHMPVRRPGRYTGRKPDEHLHRGPRAQAR